MGANNNDNAQYLQALPPDHLGAPSKKLEEIRKRNSEQGKRRCRHCPTILSESNPHKNICFACEKKIRMQRISTVSTRFVDDFDIDASNGAQSAESSVDFDDSVDEPSSIDVAAVIDGGEMDFDV
jgi:hypothetical protein